MFMLLMQLRKCCNHPFLFKGAETGETTIDGLIEASGKLQVRRPLPVVLSARYGCRGVSTLGLDQVRHQAGRLGDSQLWGD